MSGPVAKRIATQPNACVDRERKKGNNGHSVKELHDRIKLYTLAKSLMQYEVENAEFSEVASSLAAIHKARQQIPPTVCLGIWRREVLQMVHALKMQAPPEMLARFCDIVRSFAVVQDQQCKKFDIAAPRLCVLTLLVPGAKAARQFEAFVGDALVTLIGSRSDFSALENIIVCLLSMRDMLPEDQDLEHLVFNVMVEARQVCSGMNVLLASQTSVGADFATFADFEKLAEPNQNAIPARVSHAISLIGRLSMNIGHTAKLLTSIKTHGPNMQEYMKKMQGVSEDKNWSGAVQVYDEAISAFEKYSVFLPGECLQGYTQLVIGGVNTWASRALQEDVGLDQAKEVMTCLEKAQRVFHTCKSFDAPIEKLKTNISASASQSLEATFLASLKKYEESGFEAQDMLAVSKELGATMSMPLTEDQLGEAEGSVRRNLEFHRV